MPNDLVSAVALEKSYRKGAMQVPVLKGINFKARSGEFVSIIGQSGSGKSTLLHLLGLLDAPEVGEIQLEGQRVDDLNERTRDQLRNRVFGFIFQFYHLLPELSVLENVTIGAMVLHGRFGYMKARSEARDRARELLDTFGLGHRLRHRPRELSGGERQRVAIARALINRPKILLADEPTGNLDRTTGGSILDAIESIQQAEGLTMVMVTHDPTIAERAARTVNLVDGVVVDKPVFEES